ncbi:MAG: hypothetical protein V2I51_21440 [Anderseniella sp.]|jgi:hypothetical protein|nr:hypothetical protein [Anderseniella sp.]
MSMPFLAAHWAKSVTAQDNAALQHFKGMIAAMQQYWCGWSC